jgi:energy-coupling factor transporter ATP-binding protein EcfA2
MEPVIRAEQVSWAFRRAKKWALKNISLEIGQGECVAVMGENGAGKSTFCRLLNGIIPHSQEGTLKGSVWVDGINTADVSVAELAGRVGMVLEDSDAQLCTARVYDELAFGPENLLQPPDLIREKVAWALRIAGLSDYADYPPASLSGGQKQRLVIAAALVMADKALVLDEPTSHLDPVGAREVLSLLREIRGNEGLAVVMATHNSEEAAEFADRVCILKDGAVAALDTPRRVFSDAALLRENWILPPQVSELANRMQEQGELLSPFPIFYDEALAAVLDWYKRHG